MLDNNNLVTFNGFVEKYIYRDEHSGYTVMLCYDTDHQHAVTVVGMIPVSLQQSKNQTYRFSGEWVRHEKFGRQFSLTYYEMNLPVTKEGIEKFLSSSFVKGISKAIAKRIVVMFGVKTFDVLNQCPEQLLNVNGIGNVRLNKIIKSWNEQKEIRNILTFLKANDITDALAMKIFRKFGVQSVSRIQENPYCLADEIDGIGFQTADRIALRLGFAKDCYFRIRSGILYLLREDTKQGNCFMFYKPLLKQAQEMLGVDEQVVTMSLDDMADQKPDAHPYVKFVGKDITKAEDKAVYLPFYYYAERSVASMLLRIQGDGNFHLSVDRERVSYLANKKFADEQWEAIKLATSHKVMILTGGPGTGKTTTVNGILAAYSSTGAKILLAAPTGRAAKRMKESTGKEAKTIHRMLGYGKDNSFQFNEDNPLSGDILVVDECSMIDISLMYHLLLAVPDTMSVIFVGDADQLPSVGAGNVFHDMIQSDMFPVVRLNKIFRQAESSRIITNAHKINQGVFPDIRNGSNSDFFFIDVDKELDRRKVPLTERIPSRYTEEAATIVTNLMEKRLPQKGFSVDDIQILTPQKNTPAGTILLNKALQTSLNHNMEFFPVGKDDCIKVGDRVMQIKNNYDKNVFNGDVGIVESINYDEKELLVNFDGVFVTYDKSDIDEIILSYAATIHKSQGSEYKVVIIPLVTSFWRMLHRNLLYTGVTRAKELLVIVGTQKALRRAVYNNEIIRRNTLLVEWISDFAQYYQKD